MNNNELYQKGMPTLDTLRANGKINLIDYPDPNEKVTEKPRKHLHSYLIFVKDTRNDLKIANPNLSFRELSQLMADRWKNLSDYKRAEYEVLSQEDKRIRDIQLIKYENYIRENPSAAYNSGYKRKPNKPAQSSNASMNNSYIRQ